MAHLSAIEVRSTVHLVDLPLGARVLVDSSRPYIRMLLENGHLVRTGREGPIAAQEAPQERQEPSGGDTEEPVEVTATPVDPPEPKPRKPRKRAPSKTKPS